MAKRREVIKLFSEQVVNKIWHSRRVSDEARVMKELVETSEKIGSIGIESSSVATIAAVTKLVDLLGGAHFGIGVYR